MTTAGDETVTVPADALPAPGAVPCPPGYEAEVSACGTQFAFRRGGDRVTGVHLSSLPSFLMGVMAQRDAAGAERDAAGAERDTLLNHVAVLRTMLAHCQTADECLAALREVFG